MFSDLNVIKLKIIKQKYIWKIPKYVETNSTLLNDVAYIKLNLHSLPGPLGPAFNFLCYSPLVYHTQVTYQSSP